MSRFPLLLLALLVAAPATFGATRSKPAAQPKAAAARPKAPAAAALRQAPTLRVTEDEPLDLLHLEAEKRATLTSAGGAGTSLEALFDGNRTTFARVSGSGSESWAQITFAAPRRVTEASTLFPEGARWSLLAADSEADMRARSGSFRTLIPLHAAQSGRDDRASVSTAGAYRVYRLECPGREVEIADWSLYGPQQIAYIEVEPFGTEVERGGVLQLRAIAHYDGGGRQNVTLSSAWELEPAGLARVDNQGRLEGLATGSVRVAARYGGISAVAFPVQILPHGRPDLDVTFIERQPRKGGGTPTWYAHIMNYGTAEAPATPVEWRLDGRTIRKGNLPKVPRYTQTEVVLSLPEDGHGHTLELVIDPDRTLEDENPENNRLLVYTDARSVGFWVENSVHRFFHQRQRELRAGSNSWEDWAQRQIRTFNETAGPSGEHWRLDHIRVVADGMLPLAGGSAERNPDRNEKGIERQAGFPTRKLYLFRDTVGRSDKNPFYLMPELLQQLSRAD